MDRIGKITANHQQGHSSRTDHTDNSQSQQPSMPDLRKIQAMGDVIDRSRLDRQWNVHDNETQMAVIQSCIHALDRENVPHEAYGELYDRFVSTRARVRIAGKNPPEFGPDALVAQWIGEEGLAATWGTQGDSVLRLSTTATTLCKRCYGTGMESIFDEKGKRLGVRKGCNHEFIDETDPHTLGIDQVIAANKLRDDQDLEIIKKAGGLVAADFYAEQHEGPWSKDQLWHATITLFNAKRYIEARNRAESS